MTLMCKWWCSKCNHVEWLEVKFCAKDIIGILCPVCMKKKKEVKMFKVLTDDKNF